MKKAVIVYDTKRGSTETISGWIKDFLEKEGWQVSLLRAGKEMEFKGNYDLVIIGSPIYYEKPLKSVREFTEQNREKLSGIPAAIFVVNMADLFGHLTESYIKIRYIGALEKLLKTSPIITYPIRGWLRKPGEKTQKDVGEFVKLIINHFKANS